jgi:endonuclease/exonuclease/phosphatase family metal-dependent hydrolase
MDPTTSIRLALLALAIFVDAPHAYANPTIEKLSTWNLNWLTQRPRFDPALPDDVRPRRPQDFDQLRAYADHLNADVIAFQEVDGAATAARVFDPTRYTIITIAEPVVQQVALAVRRPMTVHQNPDLTALDVEPTAPHPLRDGLDATLTFPDGATLRVLVVHLKNGCHRDRLARSRRPQCALFGQQITPLADWVAARQAEHVPFALMGDFNRVMDRSEELSRALYRAGDLTRVTEGSSDPCWDGSAFIDHIFLGGPARAWLVPDSLRVMTYHTNDPRDQDRLSDHCPVSIQLSP